MKGSIKLAILFLSLGGIFIGNAVHAQVPGNTPDTAYDTANNRYVVVFEQDTGSGNSQIFAQFRNPDGSAVAGDPVRISDPRPTQGCFYGDFDAHNNDITVSTDCPQNKNPSVAYNNGQYLIAWEVHGTAPAPGTAPDNQFINIFAQIVDAGTLDPLPGWEEGILISKLFIAANNAESQCGDKHACNDSQIQAWSQSKNPDVAPRLGAGGFVVTWQTNKDFIGCADPSRRLAWSINGRYVDQGFSATSTTNPPLFSVFKDDSTMMDKCEPQSNVDNGTNPRIAFNQGTNDFVIVYEVARASGGNASIGAKRATVNGSGAGEVTGSIMPDIVATVDGGSLNSPEVVSYKNNYILFASDGTNIRAKSFSSGSISASTPEVIDLGTGAKINPRASSNLGAGGQRPSGSNPDPERLVVVYEQGTNVRAAVLNESLASTRAPTNISSGSTNNQSAEVASDFHDFVAVYQGNESGQKVFARFIDSADGVTNTPPTAPTLTAQPADNVTWAPTRAYLSWTASTDSDGDTVTYNIYFGENNIPATPQETGVTGTDFVIGPETEQATGITLEANRIYKWKIEADDGNGGVTSSPVRTLNTDNSVAAWWQFNENPAGAICAGGGTGETICDSSGNNNHAVPNGGITWLPPPAAGFMLGALDFDGTNDFLSVPNAASLNPDSISLVIRLKPDGKTSEQGLADKRTGSAASSYFLRLIGVAFPLSIDWTIRGSDGVPHVVSSGGVIANVTTYQVVTTYNISSGDARIFLDGTSIANQNFGVLDRSIDSTNPLVFADINSGTPTGTFSYNGIIDEVILVDKAMSANEVMNNYNATQ